MVDIKIMGVNLWKEFYSKFSIKHAFLFSLALAFMVFTSSLLISSSAHASGDFLEVDNLTLNGDICNGDTYNWSTGWSNRDKWLETWDVTSGVPTAANSTDINTFFDALDYNIEYGSTPESGEETRGWAVSQDAYDYADSGNIEKVITISIFDPNTTFDALDSPLGYLLANPTTAYNPTGTIWNGAPIYFISIYLNPNAGCRLQMAQYNRATANCMTSGANYCNATSAYLTPWGTNTSLYPPNDFTPSSLYGFYFVNSNGINYGSTSGTIPGSPPSTVDPVPYQPDLQLVTASGYYMVVRDGNFNTFDGVPFLCESETIPIIHYELFSGEDPDTDVLIDSGVWSPSVPLQYTLPSEAQFYTLTGYYDCGEDDLVFDNTSFLTFELNAYGGVNTSCDDSSIEGWYCSFGSVISFGVISSTLNGIVAVIFNIQSIDPTYCNTNWISTINFENDIIPVQDFPQSMCDNAESLYLEESTPYYIINVWENILLKGAAIMLLVFGLLSIFGIRVKLPSPLQETEATSQAQSSSVKNRVTVTRIKGKK